MLHLFSILLLALSANIDNLVVAMAYGFKRLKIGMGTNLFIAFVSATATFLSISVGEDLESAISIAVANALGSALLVGVGLWMMWDVVKRARKRRRQIGVIKQERMLAAVGASASTRSESPLSAASARPNEEFQELLQEFSYERYLENPEKADQDRSGYIDVRESIALAFGLSLNNLGTGMGAGISNLDVGLTTGLVFGLSVLAFLVGYRLGDRFTHKLSRFWHRSGLWAGLLSGGLIAIAGIYEYFVL